MEQYSDAVQRSEPLPAKVRFEMGIGTPEDVAPLFVFLGSEAAEHITGQCIGLAKQASFIVAS